MGISVSGLIEVGAGYGIFLDEWRKLSPSTNLVAIEPSIPFSAECRAKGLIVVEEIVEQLTGSDSYADLVVSF